MDDGRFCLRFVRFELGVGTSSQVHRETQNKRAQIDGTEVGRQTLDGEAHDAREIGEHRRYPDVARAQVDSKACASQARDESVADYGGEAAEHCKAHDFTVSQLDVARTSRRQQRWNDGRRYDRRQRLSGAILELQSSQARVQPAARAQARVRSFLDNLALIHDDDAIGRAHGRETVRDDDRGPVGH